MFVTVYILGCTTLELYFIYLLVLLTMPFISGHFNVSNVCVSSEPHHWWHAVPCDVLLHSFLFLSFTVEQKGQLEKESGLQILEAGLSDVSQRKGVFFSSLPPSMMTFFLPTVQLHIICFYSQICPLTKHSFIDVQVQYEMLWNTTKNYIRIENRGKFN